MQAKQYKDHFEKLKAARQNWDTMYQVLGEYISLIKQNFEGQPASGDFLIDDIFDSKAAYAAINSASSLQGMLWSGTAKQSIFLREPDGLEITTELAEYYERITDVLTDAFDSPYSNFALSFDEYMLDQMIFGTSGIGVEKGTKSLLKFKPYGVKELYIDEGADGLISDIFLFFEWSVKRTVAEYGIDNVSDKVRQKYEQGKFLDTVKILICIVPREIFKAEKGYLAMPYASYHIEYDSCHMIKEGGYSELPIKIGRFKKLNYERYGRSSGMFALPDIKEANVLAESIIVATEKVLDMPKGVLDDGILGGGTIDFSAGSITTFNSSAQMGNRNPVFDIGSPPDISWAKDRLMELHESIAQHFYIDRLLDFNNETQMTFGEAQIRAGLRNASLSSLFARQIAEVLTPVIDRAVNILFQLGELGVAEGSEQEQERINEGKEVFYIPDELLERIEKGQDIYKVGYRTQAANAARSEEYIAIIDVLGFGIQSLQIDPTVSERINLHEGVKQLADIRGLPVGVIREDDEVEERINARREAEEGAQTMNMMQQGAGIVESLASANKAVRE